MSAHAARSRWMTTMAMAGALIAAAALGAMAAGDATGAAAAAGRRIEVSVRDGVLDARIQGVVLSEALAAVGHAAQARVTILHVDPAAPVSLRSDGLTLEEGLQKLLRGQSYVLVYRDRGAAGRLAEIILLGKGRGPGDQAGTVSASPAASSVAVSGDEASREALPPPANRGFEVQRRGRSLPVVDTAPGSGSDRPRPGGGAVTLALASADEHMRLAALAQIGDGTEAAPMRMLARMAREDASPTIRMQVLDILVDQSAARARGPLRRALRDPDAEVQYHALELLDRIGPETLSPAAAGRTPHDGGRPVPQQSP